MYFNKLWNVYFVLVLIIGLNFFEEFSHDYFERESLNLWFFKLVAFNHCLKIDLKIVINMKVLLFEKI